MSPTPHDIHRSRRPDASGGADGVGGAAGPADLPGASGPVDSDARTTARGAGWAPLHETDPWSVDPGRTDEWLADAGRTDGGHTDPGASVNHTGTTVVALTTDDATVLAADRRASLGGRFVSSKDAEKVHRVHPTAALATSGAVGHLQQLTDTLRAEASLYETRRGEPMSLEALSTVAANLLRRAPLLVTPVLGGVDAEGPRVVSLDAGGGSMADRYAAAGSGMQLAYGVLEREYADGLDLADATALAARAVEAAGERDTASGDGLTLATVTAGGVEIEGHETPGEVA